MNSKRSLMMVLVGLAMLATPIAAAAKDHNSHADRVARSFSGRNVAPAVVTGHEFHNGSTWMPAPAGIARHDWREHRAWENANAYSNYGNRGYYAAPAYVAAPVYSGYGGGSGGGYGGGNGCGNAQRVMRTYARDRATGHPAAAADVLRQNQWALRSGCAASAGNYGGGGLLGGLGGLGGYRGGQQYNNNGGGLFSGLGGLGGNRNAPAYGNSGYNTGYNNGYGQPNGGGSSLAPLLQYIR